MKHILVTFLFFINIAGYSQLDNTTFIDETYLKKLSKKNSIFRKQNNLDSAIFYANKLLIHSKSIKDTSYILKAYKKLAQYHRLNNSPFSSVKFYNQTKELSLVVKDTISAVNALRYIAFIKKESGDYNGSEIDAIEALQLIEKRKDSTHKLALFNHLGITSKSQKNYGDALNWYNDAFKIATNPSDIANIKYNIALIQLKKENYKEAKKSLYQVYNLPIIHKTPSLKAKIKDNLAFTKSILNEPNAEKELLEALSLRKQIKDDNGQYASHIHMIQYYKDRDKNNRALSHAKQAYAMAKKIKSADAQTEALSYLIQLEENPKKAAVEYHRLTDSVTTARQRAKNQFAKIKYDTEKNRERILELNAETAQKDLKIIKETSRRNILILISSLLVISVVSITLIWRQRIKTARNKQHHATSSRLSKKLHDEVGNDLYYLMLQLQKDPDFTSDLDKVTILQGFDTVYHKVRDFSRDNTIETGEEYNDELLSLLDSYGDQNTKVITSELDRHTWCEVSDHKKKELYLVLKELLTNMKRHSQATYTAVTFTKKKKKIVVNYIDNGIGMDLTTPFSKNGLRNVENRMHDIGGTITFDSKPNEGFKATVVFAP